MIIWGINIPLPEIIIILQLITIIWLYKILKRK